MTASEKLKSFKIVYIPADPLKPLEERIIKYTKKTEVSCLIDALKPHFAKSSTVSSDQKIKEKITEMIKQQQQQTNSKPIDITDSLLSQIQNMSAIDTVALQNNKKSTNYEGIMLYVDDQAVVKQLQPNQRATDLAMKCGVSIQIMGDAFLSRNFDDDDEFRRMNFTLEEVEKNSSWIEKAKNANVEGKSAKGQQDLKEFMQQMVPNAHVIDPSYSTSSEKTSIKSETPVVAGSARQMCSEGFGCSNPGPKRCARCHDVGYCSKECQRRDWPRHKVECNAIAKRLTEMKLKNTENRSS